MKKRKDLVTIKCYSEEEVMERKEAINLYTEAMFGSEGSEQERYCRILAGLFAGYKYCSDDVD